MTAPKLAQYYSEKEDDGRAYKHPLTGEKLPSITTILKMADKAGLSQWAADQAVNWCVKNWHLLGARSDEDAYKAARWQWKNVRDERAQVGTGVHETIEALHTGSWDFPTLDEEQDRIMEHWYMLNTEYVIEPIMSEFTVWNAGLYAGTADGYWSIDGVKCLVDVKTSKNHWPEHDAQLSALFHAPVVMIEGPLDVWKEVPAPEYEKVAIIHLREDKHEILWVEDMDLHFDKFMGYHQVYTATQALKKRGKDVGF